MIRFKKVFCYSIDNFRSPSGRLLSKGPLHFYVNELMLLQLGKTRSETVLSSLEEVADHIRSHELANTVRYVCWSTPKGFGCTGLSLCNI